MKIEIKYLTRFWEITKKRGEIITFDEISITIKDLLSKLTKVYGNELQTALFNEKTGDLSTLARILVNHKDIMTLSGLGTTIRDGDRVALIYPVSGG